MLIVDVRGGDVVLKGGIITHEKCGDSLTLWLNTGYMIELEEEDIRQIKEGLDEGPKSKEG